MWVLADKKLIVSTISNTKWSMILLTHILASFGISKNAQIFDGELTHTKFSECDILSCLCVIPNNKNQLLHVRYLFFKYYPPPLPGPIPVKAYCNMVVNQFLFYQFNRHLSRARQSRFLFRCNRKWHGRRHRVMGLIFACVELNQILNRIQNTEK